MPLTPSSSTTAYAQISDFLVRYDVRTVGDLLSDQQGNSQTPARLTPTQVAASTTLLALLLQASGEIELAAQAGKRYLPADLNALLASNTAGTQQLIGMTCDLTFARLLQRRPLNLPDLPIQCKMALAMLDLLRGGQRIFAFAEAAQAGMDVERIGDQGCTLVRQIQPYLGCGCHGCGGPWPLTNPGFGCGCGCG